MIHPSDNTGDVLPHSRLLRLASRIEIASMPLPYAALLFCSAVAAVAETETAGCWFCVCRMAFSLLEKKEKKKKQPCEHQYACDVFCKIFIFLTVKVGVCVCVQGVMQDVEILVMPQGYISQCPDLNRSECHPPPLSLLTQSREHFIESFI